MSNELKPCPFCGSEATIEEALFSKHYHIRCKNNMCVVHLTHLYETEEEAIEAWNTRIDKNFFLDMCLRINREQFEDRRVWLYDSEWFVPERTCERGEEFWECSECGKHGLLDTWKYCPNCGAKVVAYE